MMPGLTYSWYRTIPRNSKGLFLLTLLSKTKIADKKQRAAKLKAIQQVEYMKKLWPKLQKYAKGEVRTGLDCVEVPIRDSDGEISGWRSVTSPYRIVQYSHYSEH